MGDGERAKWLERFQNVFDWLYGGDYDIQCWKIAVVKIRFSQICCSVYHDTNPKTYPPGTYMIVERAKVDGKFGSAYTCFGCIERSEKEMR